MDVALNLGGSSKLVHVDAVHTAADPVVGYAPPHAILWSERTHAGAMASYPLIAPRP